MGGLEMITSASNSRVKNVIKLQKKVKERKEQNSFIVEGIKMFKEAPVEQMKEVYISKSLYEKMDLEEKLSQISYEVVEDNVFVQMSDTKTPQGVLSVLEMFHYDLDERLAGANGTWMVLEDIQDPGNLGTILRTGEGAGIEGVIMTNNTVDIYNPKTIRSTMGSLYRVPFFITNNIEETIQKMKENGFSIYAAHLAGEKFYDEFSYEKKTAFLIGNEGNGLKETTAKLATSYLKIPMEGNVESLNAAVASSILMYEAFRQKRSIK